MPLATIAGIRDRNWTGGAHLALGGIQQAVHDILVCRIRKATVLPGLLVLLIAFTQPLGAKVESISKRLVDAVEDITAGHEDALEGGRAGPRVSGHEDGCGRHGESGMNNLNWVQWKKNVRKRADEERSGTKGNQKQGVNQVHRPTSYF